MLILTTALCAKGPFGTCPRPKLKKGYFNYDKIFERGTTRLWVILIMGREN
jgi:hypothetical protein